MGLQLALTALWRSYGVEPDAVIGHSMGEVTAAVVAGALSPAEGLRVIATRSRLMSTLAGQGAVALLELDAEATQQLIADYPEVSLAGYLSPRQSVVAGSVAQIRCGDRCGQRRAALRQAGEYGGRLAYRADGSRLARITLGVGRSETSDADDSVHLHRCRFFCDAGAGRRLLGRQRAPTGAVRPCHHNSSRKLRHLHRNQPTSPPHPRHHRHAANQSPSHHRHIVARRRRHAELPHQCE